MAGCVPCGKRKLKPTVINGAALEAAARQADRDAAIAALIAAAPPAEPEPEGGTP